MQKKSTVFEPCNKQPERCRANIQQQKRTHYGTETTGFSQKQTQTQGVHTNNKQDACTDGEREHNGMAYRKERMCREQATTKKNQNQQSLPVSATIDYADKQTKQQKARVRMLW